MTDEKTHSKTPVESNERAEDHPRLFDAPAAASVGL